MSGTIARIRSNSIYSFFSVSIRLVTNFFLFIGIARFYGPETFGQFTAAHTFSILFTLFADFGFDMLLATEISKDRGNAANLARQYLSIKLVFCFVATIAMLLIPSIHPLSDETRILIYIFSAYVFISAMNNFFFALFKGFEELQHETRISLYVNIFLFVLIVILGMMQVPITSIAIAFIVSRVLGLVLAVKTASDRIQNFHFQIDFSRWRLISPQIVVFGIHYLFGNLFFQMDTLLLSLWRSDYDVGIYQSVFKLIALALIVPDIAINALMPTLSRFHLYETQKWGNLGKLLNKTLFFIALPISLTLFVDAEQIIHLVYGNKTFSEAAEILRVFSLIVLIRYGVETYALMLTTSKRQVVRMGIVVGATVLNLTMNLFFIKWYGPYGAALVSLFTNVAVGAGYIIATGNLFKKWFVTPKIILPLLFTFGVALTLWIFPQLNYGYMLPGAIVCLCLFSYYVGFSRDERLMIFTLKGRQQIV